jgi:8-oxo-dGTP pyrophosphatase MutT (NUDIX family)
MSWDPQKFFIGLVDLFSVWLPGALLAYLVKLEFGIPVSSTEGWVVFLFASYLVGHFVFLLGARLDDFVYDPLRDGTDAAQVRRLAEGNPLSPSMVRTIARSLFRRDDKPLQKVIAIKQAELGAAGSAINAFQWCKAKLALDHPAALTEVHQFEADSKFFRSLCIILILLVAWQLLKAVSAVVAPASTLGADGISEPLLLAGGVLVVLFFAFSRYAERRSKAVCQAYWFALTAAHAGNQAPAAATSGPGALTHAGGVVLRYRGGRLPEYLRVEAKGAPGLWVLPKGHIEADESAAQAAVREVLEESGLWARVHEPLETVSFDRDGSLVTARFFLMEELEPVKRKRRKPHLWLPPPKARADAPRKVDWASLDAFDDLPLESQKIVAAALARFRPQATSSAAPPSAA